MPVCVSAVDFNILYICFFLTVCSVFYKHKDIRKASSLHSIWSLPSFSKPVHYSCPSHWRPMSCCILGFPFAFKHFNATLIHQIMYLSDTYSQDCEHIWSFLPFGQITQHRPAVMKPHYISAFGSKYICIWFSFSPFLSEVHKYIHTCPTAQMHKRHTDPPVCARVSPGICMVAEFLCKSFTRCLTRNTHHLLLNVPDAFQRILALPQTARVKIKTFIIHTALLP